MTLLKKIGIALPPMPSTPPTHQPDRATLLQLALIIGLAVLMHFKIADLRIGIFAVAVFVIKLGLLFQGRAAPNRLIMMLLTIFSLVLIIALYGGWNGQRAGISFLVLLVALKFLESRGLRDYFVVCLILYFLAASSFLFDSSIISIMIVLLYTLAITSILYRLSNPSVLDTITPFKESALMVLKAVPLAILLFFFFPRIQGDFGFLPSQDQRSSRLSDSLVAGEMAASAFDTALAFRAEFEDEIPSNNDLYWRVKVMSLEQSFVWRVLEPSVTDFVRSKALSDQLSLEQGRYQYSILHEQSNDLFIPYLDYIAGIERGRVLYNYSVVQQRPSGSSFRYRGSSSLTPKTLGQAILRERYLQKQSVPSARMQSLLTQWRNIATNDMEKVRVVYQYLLDNPFAYSLTPPGLDENNPVDDFLFNTRTGYCEHYASAFTLIMRWLGVPARVVAGYQGGRLNNSGQFLEVRYSDAHAWSEVWVNGQWMRVDPTTAVSPERIEFGMEALMELWDSDALNGDGTGRALADFLNPGGTTRLLRQMQDAWRNVGYQWKKWVVDYDVNTQKELLEKMGLESSNVVLKLVLLMFAGAGALTLFYFWRLVPRRIKRSDLEVAYLRFIRKLKKAGVIKNPSDSPSDVAVKASQRFPDLSKDITQICADYQQLRYGKSSENPDNSIKSLNKQINNLRLKH